MIGHMLLLLAVQTVPSPPQTVTVAEPVGRLEIPDVLGPAVSPYMFCLIGSSGTDLRGADGKTLPNLPAKGSDCTPARAAAAKVAEAILERQGKGKAESRAEAEAVLVSMDAFAATLSAPPATPDGSIVVDRISATPTFPWALRAQVGRYSQCVNEGFSRELKLAHPVRNGADSRAPFAKAKAGCAETRAIETAEADAILSETESDPAKRAATIAAALDTVDVEGDSFAAAADEAAARYKASNPQE
jgi:hypothetical protein